MVKLYARVAGAVLALLGLVGLLAGGGYLFGIFNIDLFEDILHLVTGAVLLYAGFMRDARFARDVVGVLSLTYLLYGVVGLIYPRIFGVLPDALTPLDNLFHLAVGVAGVVVIELSRRGAEKA